MKQKLTYLNISGQDLQSLYKLYYVKNLSKVHKDDQFTTFIFYGTIIAINPIKRMECNHFFNKNSVTGPFVKISIMPYSNFKAFIRFSKLNQIKIRIKGEVCYQIEIRFLNKPNTHNTTFEKEAQIFITITNSFNLYINPNLSKNEFNTFFPSIRIININEGLTSFTRYTSIYK